MDSLQRISKKVPGGLRPGASQAALEAAEKALGQQLPEEWREFYRLHDGESDDSPGIFFGMGWLSLEEMVRNWRTWMDLLPEYQEEGQHYSVPPGAIQEHYIDRGWIPIAHDFGGNHLGIDLNPGPQGQPGQIINFGRDQEIKRVICKSPADLWRFVDENFGRELDLLEGFPEETTEEPMVLSPAWQAIVTDPKRWVKNKEVYLMRKGLTDLEGLRWCKGLLKVSFAANGISNLLPLAGLAGLRSINANGNPVEDLSPLSGLQDLRELTLTNTRVTDLRPLQGLEQLKELYLGGTAVTDLSCLPLGLNCLSLPEGFRDWGVLARLSKLKTLSVAGWEPGLEKLKGLRELTVQVRPGDDLSGLAQLSRLHRLSLFEAKDASFLSGMTGLRELSLNECNLPDVNGLRGNAHFTTFKTYESPVADLSGLLECPALAVVAGSFEQFMYLKDRVKADYSSIRGDMTDEQRELWLSYNRS
ncbi:MAG: SMI1/KNR4 family protein [Candidatus Eremiobacteraeota bacterium]|nr:SMI1/KNR4 family protein [Candidatus Eremiobacteraeota bacterium]